MRKRRGRMMGPLWYGKFRGSGYRLTVPRKAILDVLGKASRHLSAEDVYLEVHKSYPHVGLTTVYRTLDLLAQMGLIDKSDFGDGRARYEMAGVAESGHHHHLVCTGCRRVIDYSDFMDEEVEFLRRVEKGLSRKYDFEIRDHLIRFYGLCDKCRAKKSR